MATKEEAAARSTIRSSNPARSALRLSAESSPSPRARLTRGPAESRVCVGRARLGGPCQPDHRQRPPRAEFGDSPCPAEASTLPSTAVRERHGAGRNDQSESSGRRSSPAGGDRFTPRPVTPRRWPLRVDRRNLVAASDDACLRPVLAVRLGRSWHAEGRASGEKLAPPGVGEKPRWSAKQGRGANVRVGLGRV
jgi:hypothetical protein